MPPLLPGNVQATAISSSFRAFLHAMEEEQIMLKSSRRFTKIIVKLLSETEENSRTLG